MTKLRWQDFLVLLLGLWIAVSPWMVGFSGEFDVATWNAVAVGVALVALAAIDLDAPQAWEEWAMAALGVWSMVSPWVLGLTSHQTGTMSMVAAGLAVVVLAGWELFATKRAAGHDEHAHGH